MVQSLSTLPAFIPSIRPHSSQNSDLVSTRNFEKFHPRLKPTSSSKKARAETPLVEQGGTSFKASVPSVDVDSSLARGSADAASSAQKLCKKRRWTSCANVSSVDYFEKQSGAWCGMHALNNLLRGPLVDRQSCKAAALQVRDMLDGADLLSSHLDPHTGYLSIDVINLLGSANLGIHVAESHTAWETVSQCHGASALINWNQRHWTVLEAWPPDDPVRWRHTNSIECANSGLRYGRRECESADVAVILAEISIQYGSATLHRITCSND